MRCAVLFLTVAAGFAQQRPGACSADGIAVNALTGEPVPRALIEATGSNAAGATADGTGHWKITGLVCGRVNLMATKPGFLTGTPGRATTNATATVSPDSPAHDVRVELTPQSVIAGKVLDEFGDPMQNVQILALTSRVVEGKRTFTNSGGANTNDLGEYRLAGLSSGKVIVCARALPQIRFIHAAEDTVFSEMCYPGPAEGGSASALTLGAGREVRVDFNMRRTPAVRITGKVTGMPEGAGAMVMLQSRSAGGGRGGQALPSNMVRDGTFELRGVPPGAWMLAVDYWEAGKRLFARTPVDVGGSDVEGVVLHLDAGFTVTGTVRLESQSGQTLKPQQLNVNLRALDTTAGTGAVQWDKARTAFTIQDATPGTYTLNAGLPAPFYLKSALLGGRDLAREFVPITQAAGPVEVVIADDSGVVQGHLTDANGDPATGWAMLLRDGHQQLVSVGSPDGSFKISGVAPGDYKLYGWDDWQQAEWADDDWLRRNAGSGVAVSVSPGQTVSDVKVTRVTVPQP